MPLNPFVWIMLTFGTFAFGIDTQLVEHGVQVPAIITNVVADPVKNNSVIVKYTYTVHDRDYSAVEHHSATTATFKKGDPALNRSLA